MEPRIELIPISHTPPPPAGMKPFWPTGPDTFDQRELVPALVWERYIYWTFEYLDNRWGFAIIAYDHFNKIVKQWDKQGPRYIWDITLERAKKGVIFSGQGNEKLIVKLEDLCINEGQYNLLNPPPVVKMIPVSEAPAVPPGLVSFWQLPSNETAQKSGIPVLVRDGCTYRTYEYPDNRLAFAIVAFNKDGKIVKDWNVNGVRYISDITVDDQNKRVTFLGQAGQTAAYTWDDLKIDEYDIDYASLEKFAQMELKEMPISAAPNIPPELKMEREWLTGPNSHTMSKQCTVLIYQGYTYWAFQNEHNANSIGIVAYDSKGNLVKHWGRNGTRYLWSISLDPIRKTVSFWGQGSLTVVMGWDELKVG